jgi:diphthamide synthase (EF-2-diphthine--ammonia ligase)
VDPCGERGEFHSFAYRGPMFRAPIPVTLGEIVDRDGFTFADVKPTWGRGFIDHNSTAR